MTKQPVSYNLLWWLIAIAALAFALRIGYQSGIGAIRDSSGEILEALQNGRISLYFYFQHAILFIFNSQDLRIVTTIQALLDSFTVLAIALASMALSRKLVIIAAITAAIIPNFIVHSSSILSETLFLAFFSWGFCALLWAVRSQVVVSRLWISGLLFGLALLCRPVLQFFPIFLMPLLAYVLHTRQLSWPRSITLALTPVFAMTIVATPLLLYNFFNFGYFQLSSQSGPHLLFWVFGCLATPSPCAERARLVAELTPIVAERTQALGIDRTNEFAISAIESNLALKLIFALPVWQVAWGMIWGAFRNLVQTGFYQVLTQYNEPQTFFSTISGTSFLDRLLKFLDVNRSHTFMILWMLSQGTLLLSRCVQLYGAILGLWRHEYRGSTILLLGTIFYFLLINGPIADPKYRMPMEPALIILFAMGVSQLIAKLRGENTAVHEVHSK